MIILSIRFESGLSEQEVLAVAEERLPQFREVPGLLQKYYVTTGEPNIYSGIYVWDSMESLQNYRASDLAASIPAAYKVKGQPEIEILNGFMTLRD